MQKQKNEALIRVFEKMTDEDQAALQAVAQALAAKNPRKQNGLRLVVGFNPAKRRSVRQ